MPHHRAEYRRLDEGERASLRRMFAIADRLTEDTWLLAFALENHRSPDPRRDREIRRDAAHFLFRARDAGLIVGDRPEGASPGWRLASEARQ